MQTRLACGVGTVRLYRKYQGTYRGSMENRLEKSVDNDMDTRFLEGVIGIVTNIMVLDSLYHCGIGYLPLT